MPTATLDSKGTIDYSALLNDLPAGAWVAIAEDRNEVVAYAAELQTALDLARERGVCDPLIVRVQEQQTALFL
jgi:hypothetical protein